MARESIGQYQIVRKLGEGGMGQVYEARDDRIKRRVAIKLLRPRHLTDPETVSRFFNEAVAANLVEHPGLVQIYEYGQLEDGSAYLVMEYLSGETLEARLKRDRSLLSAAAVLSLGTQLASSLAAAHDRGIVHRDLKPSNIMLVEDPALVEGERVKLLDFGIAKLLSNVAGVSKQPTLTGKFMGTPLYMSPEQCRGSKDLDGKADVYSFGVLLYLLLAGRPPFVGVTEYDVIAMHLYDTPPPLGRLRSELSPALLALVHRMLEKEREKRPAMREVFAELKQLRSERLQRSDDANRPEPTALDLSAAQVEATTNAMNKDAEPTPPAKASVAAALLAWTVQRLSKLTTPIGPQSRVAATLATGPDPTMIGHGPMAPTVPISPISKETQARWLVARRRQRQLVIGAAAALILGLLLYAWVG